jgi:hypothetical protein
MATITLTIPDAVMPRVLDGLVPFEPPAGMTQAQAAKALIIDFIKQAVRDTEKRAAIAAAQQIQADVEVT